MCEGCNGHKAAAIEALDPMTETIVSLFHPRHDTWATHFAWNEASNLVMIGLTSTGRATIERLQLNRISVCNLRQLLVLIDEHPP